MDLSSQFDIPLTEDAITIEREDRRVSIEGHYAKSIELAPRLSYPWPFTWTMEVMTSTLVPPQKK